MQIRRARLAPKDFDSRSKTHRALSAALLLLAVLLAAGLAGAAGNGATTATAATPNLVAAYGFGAGAGTTLRDDSGNPNNGTISGATWTASGKYGSALSFDGVNDWVTVPDSASLDLTSAMTLEAWVRPTDLGWSWRTAIVKERPGNLTYGLYAHDGGPGPSGHVYVGADRYTAASSVLPANTWAHLATTYDGATIRVYVNGAQVASRAQSGAIATSDSPLRLGGNAIWSEWFKGSLDEVRIYNRALSAAEIKTDLATPISAGSPAPGDTQKPTTPANLRTTGATQTSVSLAWDTSSDNVGVTGYGRYSNNALMFSGTGTGYTYGGLTCGTNYTLAVDAYDAAGNRSGKGQLTTATSACSTPSPTDTQKPTTPANLRTTGATQNSVSVAWDASSDNVGVTGYGRYSNNALVTSGTGSGYTFSGLACNTSYPLAVDAYDAAGNRSVKATLTASTSACTPPPPPPPPSGASLFVSASGSDANACSQAQPCRSFDRAYRVAAAGATVEVAAGSYPGQTINPDSSKTSTNDVVFRPASGASVTITGELEANGAHFEFRDMTIHQLNFPRSADDITIRNVINHGLWMQGPSNISIIGGEITCGACGYHSHLQNGGADNAAPRNILFDGVNFHDWHSASGEHVECLQILGADGVTIRNSTFKNCGTGSGGLGATADLHIAWTGVGAMTKNILLENNFFYASGNPYTIQMDDYANIDLRYNSIAGPILIFDRSGPGTSIDIIGNILRASTCTAEASGVPINWRYNVIQGGSCGATDKNAASGFTDTNNNLHLTAGAAAINAGDPSSYPNQDIDSQNRTGTPDAGADEAG